MSQNSQDRNHEDLGVLREMIEAVRAETPDSSQYADARRRLIKKLETDKKENILMSAVRNTFRAKVRWVAVTGLAVVLVALALFLGPLGRSPGQAYAAVVEQLRNALTVSFNAAWYFDENEEPTIIEMAFREPGIQRIVMTHQGSRLIEVLDTNLDQGIVLLPETKTYFEMDLASMPSVERERIELIEFISREIKSLPDRADEILPEQVIDGRTVQGFRAGGRTIWIDMEAEALAYVDNELGGTRMLMTDFRIDPEDLDDSKFSIMPPEDYVSVSKAPLVYDVSDPGEQDLIEYLRTVATWTEDHRFPATVNPLEVLSLQKEGKLGESKFTTPEEEQKEIQAFTRACQNAVMFVMKMEPGNDWHYVGKGVEYGDSDTPIAWWKPEGAAAYRVVWGDLSVGDLSAEQLARITGNGR